ncbi:MAG: type IX secretion system membrane protein PorP/SprF [Bacteroidota bacterium]|jgi:type IX secretion system PorP/SprF family membrane protein|nr:type IX secretion system membrane protein PorP/SprF [Bacteroidota bacterium]
MPKYLPIVALGILLVTCFEAKAQDPQFSQYYAAPLYLNPAFAGSAQQGRAGLNYRNQWPALDARFVTASAYFDYFFEDYNSGVGFILTSDKEGLAGLRSHSFGLQYSYQLNLTKSISFRPGFQAAFFSRDVNFDRLTFGDQFDDQGFIPGGTAEQFNTGLSKSFFDLSAGGLIYSKDFWFGYAMHHITEPNQSFISEESYLPRKNSFHGGYRYAFASAPGRTMFDAPRERSITPNFQYKFQGQFDQLDIGVYLTLEPIVFGVWYRGIPFKTYETFHNNESAIFLVGVSTNNLNIGYSYDYTLSSLGIASGGAHEISISYEFSLRDPRIPPKNVRKIPCPKF